MRRVIDAVAAWLDLRTAELRSGVSLVEAIEASEFEQDLRNVTVTAEQRADLRRGAVLLGQLGGTSDDLEAGMREYYVRQWRGGV